MHKRSSDTDIQTEFYPITDVQPVEGFVNQSIIVFIRSWQTATNYKKL